MMYNRFLIFAIVLIIVLQSCGCTTAHQADPIIGTWVYSYKDSQGHREIAYTFNSAGKYNATNIDFTYEHGPHSSGPKFGTWKPAGMNEYHVIDEAGFAGEPPYPFVYDPAKDVLTRNEITFVRVSANITSH